MNSAFYSCTNMVGNYIDTPNTSNVTDMSDMFHDCAKFNSPVNFDTSNVTTMKTCFMIVYYLINQLQTLIQVK